MRPRRVESLGPRRERRAPWRHAAAIAGLAVGVSAASGGAAAAWAAAATVQPSVTADSTAPARPDVAARTNTAARPEASAATLRVVVSGLASDRGRLHIAVCNSPASWSGKAPSFRGASTPVENRRAEFVFENVPFGDYAAKLYHDENGNDRFDVSLIGLPKESYGFSNGARAYLGQPSFERAKFTVDSPVAVVRIHLD